MEENKTELIELTLEEQLQQSNDKYLRLYAEFENYKKRNLKEKEDIRLSTKTTMLSSLLDMDNDISLAMKAIKDESSKEGVILISQKLKSFLSKQNIEEIQTETYDSDIHEVISIINTGESKIVDVISKGYKIGDKIIKYPKIVLSK